MSTTSDKIIEAPPTPKAGVAYLRRIVRSVYYPALLLVLAWGVGWTMLLYQTLETTPDGDVFMGWLMWHHLETAALWVLGGAAGICAIRWIMQRTPSLLWLTAILVVFFCRELHFAGTSTAVYVGIAGLVALALVRPDWTKSILLSRRSVTLQTMAMCCYLFAVSLDGHWWFDWNDRWLNVGKFSEEILELTGHCLMFVLAVTAPSGQTRSTTGSSPISGKA